MAMTDKQVKKWIAVHMVEGHYCNECLPIKVETAVQLEVLTHTLKFKETPDPSGGPKEAKHGF